MSESAGGADTKFETLPLEAETFKKPSAKRIANRLKKRKNLQPNEIAKRGYRRKGMR